MAQKEPALEELRALLKAEKHLHIENNDDKLLKLYLHFAKNHVKMAFEKMKFVYRLKAENSEFYAYKRDPELHDLMLAKGSHMMLANRDQRGRRIYLIRPKYILYGEFEPCELMQIDDLWIALALDEEETQRRGLVVILDVKDVSWKFLSYFTPHNIEIFKSKAENLPIRHLQVHIINAGFVIGMMVQMVFPLLGQTSKNAIFFHDSLESLHEQISPEALPEDYGGELPPVDSDQLVNEFFDRRQRRLAELLSYGYLLRKSMNRAV